MSDTLEIYDHPEYKQSLPDISYKQNYLETLPQTLDKLNRVLQDFSDNKDELENYSLLPYVYYELQNTNRLINEAQKLADKNILELKTIAESISQKTKQCLALINQNKHLLQEYGTAYTSLISSTPIAHLFGEIRQSQQDFDEKLSQINKAIQEQLLINKHLSEIKRKVSFIKKLKDKFASSLKKAPRTTGTTWTDGIAGGPAALMGVTTVALMNFKGLPQKETDKVEKFVKESDKNGLTAQFQVDNLEIALTKINEIGTAISSDIKRWEENNDE